MGADLAYWSADQNSGSKFQFCARFFAIMGFFASFLFYFIFFVCGHDVMFSSDLNVLF
jgi:hypothetical protein